MSDVIRKSVRVFIGLLPCLLLLLFVACDSKSKCTSNAECEGSMECVAGNCVTKPIVCEANEVIYQFSSFRNQTGLPLETSGNKLKFKESGQHLTFAFGKAEADKPVIFIAPYDYTYCRTQSDGKGFTFAHHRAGRSVCEMKKGTGTVEVFVK